MSLNDLRNYSSFVLRIGISLVFLWFGINQVLFSKDWVGWLPSFALNMGIKDVTLILINGVFEIIFGLLLLIGLFTRFSSLILVIHLLGIIFSLGYNDVAVRDFGLMIATLSIFFNGGDRFSLDFKLRNKN